MSRSRKPSVFQVGKIRDDGRTVVDVAVRRDPEAIAAAVRRVLDDPDLAQRVAQGGRQLAAGRAWPLIAAAHRGLYGSVLRG